MPSNIPQFVDLGCVDGDAVTEDVGAGGCGLRRAISGLGELAPLSSCFTFRRFHRNTPTLTPQRPLLS